MIAGAVILVIGATGDVGSRTFDRLDRAGVAVRGLARHAERPDIVAGDLSDAPSLRPALEGVDAVFLIWKQASASNPRAAIDEIARHARRIVYLSSLSIRDDLDQQEHPMAATHLEIEELIRASAPRWTILRAGMFMSNVLGWADELRATGVLRRPYPAAGRSPIDVDDVADVAAAVLTSTADGAQTYVLTGPEMLSEADMAHAIGDGIGRPLRSERVPPDLYRDELIADGLSEELANAAVSYWRHLVVHPEPVTDSVETLTGHPARTFDSWISSNAEPFQRPD